jgi:hypothetical protein
MEFGPAARLKSIARTRTDDMRICAGSMVTQDAFFDLFEEYVEVMCKLDEHDYVEEMGPEMFEIKAHYMVLGSPTEFDQIKHRRYLIYSVALANKFKRYTHKKYPRETM